jgi:hypothetical protein
MRTTAMNYVDVWIGLIDKLAEDQPSALAFFVGTANVAGYAIDRVLRAHKSKDSSALKRRAPK